MPRLNAIRFEDALLASLDLNRRALGVGGGPTTTENIQHLPSGIGMAAASATATVLPDSSDGGGGNGGGLTKTILEWAFAIAALLIVASLSVWKYTRLKRARALASPAHYIHARAHTLSGHLTSPRHPPNFADQNFSPDPELSRGGRRAALGLDIDSGGRRGGGGPGDRGEEDELPAYEPKGGPPKYIDVDLGRESIEMRNVRRSGVEESAPDFEEAGVGERNHVAETSSPRPSWDRTTDGRDEAEAEERDITDLDVHPNMNVETTQPQMQAPAEFRRNGGDSGATLTS